VQAGRGRRRAATGRLDLQSGDDHAFLGRDEAEALAVQGLEGLPHGARLAEGDGKRRIRTIVAQVSPDRDSDVVLCHALGGDLVAGDVGKTGTQGGEPGEGLVAQRCLHRLLAARANLGEAYAVGGEQARQRVDQHRLHAERVGDQAGVLAAGRAEAIEHVLGDIVAALHGDLLDGVRHVLHGDADAAVRHLLGRAPVADLGRQACEGLPHRRLVEALVAAAAEDRREGSGAQLAHHDVGVGDGERAAAAVALGAGVGARRLRADAEAGAVVVEDGAAARSHGVNTEHRHAQAHAGDLGLERALVLAGEVRHVGGGAAHVEADDLLETGEARGLGHADHAAGGAGEDGVAALEQVGGLEPAGGGHEEDVGLSAAARGFASPSWRGVKGGGYPFVRSSGVPPTLSLPHKGGRDPRTGVGEWGRTGRV
jgi:hypothetical protein